MYCVLDTCAPLLWLLPTGKSLGSHWVVRPGGCGRPTWRQIKERKAQRRGVCGLCSISRRSSSGGSSRSRSCRRSSSGSIRSSNGSSRRSSNSAAPLCCSAAPPARIKPSSYSSSSSSSCSQCSSSLVTRMGRCKIALASQLIFPLLKQKYALKTFLEEQQHKLKGSRTNYGPSDSSDSETVRCLGIAIQKPIWMPQTTALAQQCYIDLWETIEEKERDIQVNAADCDGSTPLAKLARKALRSIWDKTRW